MTNIAEPAPAPLTWIRSAGILLFGAGLVLAAHSDLPVPLPWAYGLLPIALFWLARHVGLLYGSLAATSTLGAVYAAGVTDFAQLFFIATLAASGLLLSASARRGARASTGLTLAAAPVLLAAGLYMLFGGMDELSRTLADRLAFLKSVEAEHRISETIGLSQTEFDRAIARMEALWTFFLPSLFAIKWISILSVNSWLATVLFRDSGAFPPFHEFSTWRVHPAAAWGVAAALMLVASNQTPFMETGANLALPLALAYTVQGVAVARFAAIALEVNVVAQAAILILVACLPVLLFAFLLVGFLDAWFDFRRRLVPGTGSIGKSAGGFDD